MHLKQHREEEEKFKCGICGLDLKEQIALDDHTDLHKNLSSLQCALCHKEFKQKGALVRHMRIHVNISSKAILPLSIFIVVNHFFPYFL